ncbi:MAG: hypothetical protein VKN72_17290 [Nostocales cyanobacterium 94392]|nr:hypothetical protein [Nostocales cyanobacterium 94392]
MKQLSVNCLFPLNNHQPSTNNHQPSTINHQLTTINYQPSTINYQLTNNYVKFNL